MTQGISKDMPWAVSLLNILIVPELLGISGKEVCL